MLEALQALAVVAGPVVLLVGVPALTIKQDR